MAGLRVVAGSAACVAFVLGVTGGVGVAHADSNDDLFIQKLKQNYGIKFEGRDAEETAIEIADEACGRLQAGYTSQEATSELVDHYGKYIPVSLVSKIIGSGVLHYCPEELARRQLGS